MKRLQYANRDQMVLYSRTIAESLSPNHEVFAFARLVDSLDTSRFLRHYSREGGKAYDPRLMLAILIYGYHRGWRSSRELQRACEENTAMRYLVGDQKVKFRAIAEFRVKFFEEIDDVFRQSVVQVVQRRVGVGADVKVDGTKIKANAANDQTFTKQELETRKVALEKKIMDYLVGGIEDDKRDDAELGSAVGYEIDSAEVEKRISDFVAEQKRQARLRLTEKPVVPGKNGEDKPAEPSAMRADNRRPVDPRQQEMFSAALKLEKFNDALEKCKDKAADEKINLTDTDARFMKNRGKIMQSYNVQVASSEGFILAADIAGNNAENDQHELPAILDQVIQNTGKRIETTTEDAGYFHAASLEYLDAHQIEGYIPAPQQIAKERKKEEDTGFESHYFRHDEKSNSYICPQGKPLEFHREFTRDGNIYFEFHGKPIHCVRCPVRTTCCSSKEDMRRGYRSLELGESHVLKHRMIHKMKTPHAKAVYKRRGAEIEPIFGNWKGSRHFWYFLLRGTPKVRTEVKLSAIAFNFGKLARLKLA